MTRVKTNLVGGFLGSGKTTLLRHVLSRPVLPEKTAVLVNEIGELGIDGEILKRAAGGVVELANGCICCQLSSDLVSAVQDIAARHRPGRLLIEATGIAEPGKILMALYGPLAGTVRVEPTVVVVDASAFDRLYEEVAYHYVMQIKAADVVLLNKTDLVAAARVAAVKKKVAGINPRAFLVPTERCRVDLLALLEGAPASGRPAEAKDHARFLSRSFDRLGRLDAGKLETFLSKLPRTVFRVKGFVDLPEGPKLLNWVCGQTEWEAWPELPQAGGSRLVFIGSSFKPESIRKSLERCQP